jgi:hypothetical protein
MAPTKNKEIKRHGRIYVPQFALQDDTAQHESNVGRQLFSEPLPACGASIGLQW